MFSVHSVFVGFFGALCGNLRRIRLQYTKVRVASQVKIPVEKWSRQNNQGTMVFTAKQREYLGFIALQSEYAGILRIAAAPLKDVVCRKSSTGNKKIFSF